MQEERHPIEGLMQTAMESIKQMMEVNTVIGEAVEAPNGVVIIPVSRVSCGFAAGGSDFEVDDKKETAPFGGGSGAGVSVQPVGFLVVGGTEHIHFLPVETNFILDRVIDFIPQLLDRVRQKKEEEPETNSSARNEQIPTTWTGV